MTPEEAEDMFTAGEEFGEERERRRVVAWLAKQGKEGTQPRSYAEWYSEAIERGAHLEGYDDEDEASKLVRLARKAGT